MNATKTYAAAAALLLGLSGAAFAQAGVHGSVGTNAAGSKSGVVGKGDSLETGPAATGTVQGERMAPDTMAPGTMAPGASDMRSNDATTAPAPGAAPMAR